MAAKRSNFAFNYFISHVAIDTFHVTIDTDPVSIVTKCFHYVFNYISKYKLSLMKFNYTISEPKYYEFLILFLIRNNRITLSGIN